MLDTLKQLIKFMQVHRKFWLAPIVLGLLLLGGLLVLAQSSSITPFLYAIF